MTMLKLVRCYWQRFVPFCAIPILAVATVETAYGQPCLGGGFFNRQVGGVSINAEGVASNATPAERGSMLEHLRANVGKPSPALDKPAGLRLVSLCGISAACTEAIKSGAPLPDEVRFLSGLQRVVYVFIVPERNDIVLAGPGEGWRVDEQANIVGATSGKPVIQLSDLLVALRSVGEAREQGISCSIDPTAEGRREFEAVLSRQRQFSPAVLKALEKAMGPQQITLSGIPEGSHLAHVLVAADYGMKRLAMGLEKSPIAGLPSYPELLKSKKGKLESGMPRWWLACNYEPLLKSEDGLAWELRGPGVKALTEDDFVDAAGGVKGSGAKSPLAQEWADRMTAKYDELSAKEPVFGELRNIMDLCVVAALLHKEGLWAKAGCEVPALTDPKGDLELASWHAPKSVSTECSFLKVGREYIITASGGVQIESFAVAGNAKIDARLTKMRGMTPAKPENQWWWQ